jgi:hypothetical protein
MTWPVGAKRRRGQTVASEGFVNFPGSDVEALEVDFEETADCRQLACYVAGTASMWLAPNRDRNASDVASIRVNVWGHM